MQQSSVDSTTQIGIEESTSVQDWSNGDMDEYVVHCRDSLKASARRMIGSRMRERMDSSDLVQDTLLVTVSKFAEILEKPQSVIYYWMLGVMKHRVQHLAREMNNHASTNPLSPLLADSKSEEVSTEMLYDELRACLIQKLDDMTSIEKTIFQMRYFESMSLEEICQETGKSEPAVRGILYRTLLKIKHSMHHLIE